jgi:hypothetical protein
VDAAVQYDCPYDGQSYILVIRNALHVPSMKNTLIPPFMLREADIRVQDMPKIQANEPSVDDHSLCFPETSFRIPLSLWGMFSYLPTVEGTILSSSGSLFKSTVAITDSPSDTLRRLWFASL